jgi:hypothetical protein
LIGAAIIISQDCRNFGLSLQLPFATPACHENFRSWFFNFRSQLLPISVLVLSSHSLQKPALANLWLELACINTFKLTKGGKYIKHFAMLKISRSSV